MSAAEILWRLRGMVSANIDLARIPLGLIPGPPLDSSMLRPGFNCCPAADGFAVSADSAPFDAWSKRLMVQAEKILENKLTFFDLVDQFVGDPVDWHRDFSASKSSPKSLSNLIDYRDFEAVGDCKLVWEPNRHHQLVVLGRAWRVSGDNRFADKVVSLLDEWLDANPFGYGMNWKSPLEVGIRLINWVWAIDLIRDAQNIDEKWAEKFLRAVYLSIWDTQRKFSRGSSANNHVIGEAAGVLVASSYFGALPNAKRWQQSAKEVLEREIVAQSFADGCTREHAFGYQLFVLQFLTLSLIAAERAATPFSPTYRDRLQQMYRFMADICADTGCPPSFGDADDGYVLDLGEKPDQATELLTVGANLFNDRQIGTGVPSETSFWLLGEPGCRNPPGRTAGTSHAYRESGYFVLRSEPSDSALNNGVRVLFDCAELGFGPIAAHGHADSLSFSLAVGGTEILVDPGTYDYFTYPEWRDYFRSTRAHNTVVVDGESQSEPLGPFLWGKRAISRLLDWEDTGGFARVIGEHDGYMRLPDSVLHRRCLTLDKQSGCVEILDTLTAKEPHDVTVCFHVVPKSRVTELDDGAVLVEHGAVKLRMCSPGNKLRATIADDEDCRGWVSTGYHRKEPGHLLELDVRTDGAAQIMTRIDTRCE